MNQEILPVVLAKNASEFSEKIKTLDGRAETVQIDIMDGDFVPNKTFEDPKSASKTGLKYELHLMVKDPYSYIKQWKEIAGVVRAIPHAEIEKPLLPLVQKIKKLGWEAGIALNPETPWEKIDNLIPILDTVLVMTVHPGKSGQPFQEAVPEFHLLSKINGLHKAHPALAISVDGGVSAETLPLLLEAGATRFAAGSAIWKSTNPLSSLDKLNKIIKSKL